MRALKHVGRGFETRYSSDFRLKNQPIITFILEYTRDPISDYFVYVNV